MPETIKCPSCGNEFEPNEAIRHEVEKELKQKAIEWQRRKNEEFQTKIEDEKRKMEKSISSDFENKLRLLEQNNKDNEEKLKEARQQQLEFMRKEQELKNREAELELSVQKKLQEEREKLSEDIRVLEEQKHHMRMKEMEKQLEDQKKLVDEMKRKAEQGSTQLQGEVQELALEELLRATFPFDQVDEVGKGVEGADCIMVIKNSRGTECGKIIFESKRTKGWSNNWIDKLKSDMRNCQADLAILVTQTFPRGMESFGEREGIWIVSFKDVISLTVALRNAIVLIGDAKKSEENKGEKMHMLYDYLTGIEFRQHIEAVVEGFMSMKQTIAKERIQMEKLWKEREKQLDKVLINTSGLYGSIKGIAGASIQDIPLLEASEETNEDDMAH